MTPNGHPGRANLSAVRHCLKNLAQSIKTENISSMAIPKIATGVGALEWVDVKPIIEEFLGNLDIPVFVYSKYVKGQAAPE